MKLKFYKVVLWDKKNILQVTWNILAQDRNEAIRQAKETHAENYNSRFVEVESARHTI